ncbi:MAG: hypothetical protein JKY52_06915 [Flavobacteriales bacterium]|nr:hypothetical protein [Flavobacteriales bacterium]
MNIKPRNSKNLKVFLALAIGVALFHISCTLLKKTHKQSYHLTTTLPGVIPIDSLLFCDETEIANIHYREDMYWTRRVYGKASDKYQSILPDTLSWIQDTLPLDTFTEIYLRHPAYQWYLVVGVTQEQARDFGQWRSDRVVDGNDSTKYLNYLTRPITSDCVSKKQSLYNLRGNVSEWIADSGVCVGGGWRDSTERVLATDTFHLTTHNAWTGFRNVCKWKKWEK